MRITLFNSRLRPPWFLISNAIVAITALCVARMCWQTIAAILASTAVSVLMQRFYPAASIRTAQAKICTVETNAMQQPYELYKTIGRPIASNAQASSTRIRDNDPAYRAHRDKRI